MRQERKESHFTPGRVMAGVNTYLDELRPYRTLGALVTTFQDLKTENYQIIREVLSGLIEEYGFSTPLVDLWRKASEDAMNAEYIEEGLIDDPDEVTPKTAEFLLFFGSEGEEQLRNAVDTLIRAEFGDSFADRMARESDFVERLYEEKGIRRRTGEAVNRHNDRIIIRLLATLGDTKQLRRSVPRQWVRRDLTADGVLKTALRAARFHDVVEDFGSLPISLDFENEEYAQLFRNMVEALTDPSEGTPILQFDHLWEVNQSISDNYGYFAAALTLLIKKCDREDNLYTDFTREENLGLYVYRENSSRIQKALETIYFFTQIDDALAYFSEKLGIREKLTQVAVDAHLILLGIDLDDLFRDQIDFLRGEHRQDKLIAIPSPYSSG